jgi:hypothetical protein
MKLIKNILYLFKNLKEKKKKKRKKYPNEKNKELKNFETIRPTSRYRAYERSMY